MKKLKILTVIFGILVMFVFGCSDHQNPVDGSDMTFSSPPNLSLISLPPGAVLDSAVLSLYVQDFANTTVNHVNIHRVTAPWDEATVTHNSFANSYDPAVVATINAFGTGWYHTEITALVQGWLNGDYPDYGMLFEQPEALWTRFASSEYEVAALRPILKICYTLGGIPECVTIQRGVNGAVSDAGIRENGPDWNYGTSTHLYAFTLAGFTKRFLLQFDVEVVPPLATRYGLTIIRTASRTRANPASPMLLSISTYVAVLLQ
jgi:hypothetical protein